MYPKKWGWIEKHIYFLAKYTGEEETRIRAEHWIEKELNLEKQKEL
jgi:hypothetical protein